MINFYFEHIQVYDLCCFSKFSSEIFSKLKEESKLEGIEESAKNLVSPNGKVRPKRDANGSPVDLNAPADLNDPNLLVILILSHKLPYSDLSFSFNFY